MRNQSIKLSAGISLLLVLLLLGLAEEAMAEKPLTLDQAVSRALDRAPELAAAREQVHAARARHGQTRAAYWPQAGVQVSYLARWPKNELPIDLSGASQAMPGVLPEIGAIDDVHHFRAGLQLGFRVLDLSRGPRSDAAEHAAGAAGEVVREVAAALAYGVRTTYLAALLSGDLAHIADRSLAMAREQLARQEAEARVGSGSELALAQARVRVAEVASRKVHAEGEQQRHLANLAALLGVKAAPRLAGDLEQLAGQGLEQRTVCRTEPGASSGRRLARSEEGAYRAVFNRRATQPAASRGVHGDAECKLFAALASRAGSSNPAVRRLQRRRQAARSLETSVSRSFWPTLSVLGKAEVEYPHAMKLEFGPLLSAGVALEWRLFDGFLRSHRAAQHRAEVRGIGRQEQAAVEQLHRRLRDLAARSGAARARLSAAKDLLRQSELQLKVARAAAQSGAATHLDRRAAELARDSAQVGVRRALMELCLIQAGELRVRGVDMVSVAASTDGRTGEEP